MRRVSLTPGGYAEDRKGSLDSEESDSGGRSPKDGAPPPDLNLNHKQNHMRTDLEMWVMDEVPRLFGADDSDDLEEEFQEDEQANKITELIAIGGTKDSIQKDKMRKVLEEWLSGVEDKAALNDFTNGVVTKISKILKAG